MFSLFFFFYSLLPPTTSNSTSPISSQILIPPDHDKLRSTERTNQKRVNERKEQYKQVRAHVKKEDGRMQAYGWSLPAKVPPQGTNNSPGSNSPAPGSEEGSSKVGGSASAGGGSSVPVPVPVYCRPLMEKEPGMKVTLVQFT